MALFKKSAKCYRELEFSELSHIDSQELPFTQIDNNYTLLLLHTSKLQIGLLIMSRFSIVI